MMKLSIYLDPRIKTLESQTFVVAQRETSFFFHTWLGIELREAIDFYRLILCVNFLSRFKQFYDLKYTWLQSMQTRK